MRYFLAVETIDKSKERWWSKGHSAHYSGGIRGKKVGLFDRNTQKYVWLKIVEPHLTKFGYIVERKTPVLGYWRNCVEPLTSEYPQGQKG